MAETRFLFIVTTYNWVLPETEKCRSNTKIVFAAFACRAQQTIYYLNKHKQSIKLKMVACSSTSVLSSLSAGKIQLTQKYNDSILILFWPCCLFAVNLYRLTIFSVPFCLLIVKKVEKKSTKRTTTTTSSLSLRHTKFNIDWIVAGLLLVSPIRFDKVFAFVVCYFLVHIHITHFI